jgi:hypothetical protein
MILKRLFDVICFVIGPFITIFFLFGFGHRGPKGYVPGGGSIRLYYPLESKIGIGIGVALICIGFLRIYWRKKEWDKEKPK